MMGKAIIGLRSRKAVKDIDSFMEAASEDLNIYDKFKIAEAKSILQSFEKWDL